MRFWCDVSCLVCRKRTNIIICFCLLLMKDYFCSIFSQEVFYLTDACNRTPSFCNFRSTQQCIIFTCQLLRGQYLQILERFLYYSHDACSILPNMLHNTRILITANSVKEQNCVAIDYSDISTAFFSLFSSTPGQQNSKYS